MKHLIRILAACALLSWGTASFADDVDDTVAVFKGSQSSASYFRHSYGYAVFPTVGEGGFIVAGAHGTGRVYARGAYVGDATVTQVSVGAQIGGQAFSQIVFFRDQAAYRKFTSGKFEFSADATAVAATAAAQASVGTTGANAGNGTSQDTAGTINTGYRKGFAVFTITKGGAMLQAAVGGQKFGFTRKSP